MTCEGFLHQPGGCSPVKLLGFTCFYTTADLKEAEDASATRILNFDFVQQDFESGRHFQSANSILRKFKLTEAV